MAAVVVAVGHLVVAVVVGLILLLPPLLLRFLSLELWC
jgi:hypothetical protein